MAASIANLNCRGYREKEKTRREGKARTHVGACKLPGARDPATCRLCRITPRSGYRVYNPEGLDMTALREVVEAVRYPGLKLRRGQAG